MSDSDLDQVNNGPTSDDNDGVSTAVDVLDDADLVVADSDDGDDATAEEAPTRRRLDWTLIIPCFVIACGLTAIVWGMASAITGSDGIDRPDAIESISPVENAQQTFQQEQIIVDLQPGYEAVLIVDGIELPTTRIGEFSGDLAPQDAGVQADVPPTAVFDPGNSRIEFRPSEGALIETLAEGRHEAQVIFWKVLDGREDGARSYRWSFNVV